ncbi:MAG: hypothetical protein ACK56I_04765, partial [bacterium]
MDASFELTALLPEGGQQFAQIGECTILGINIGHLFSASAAMSHCFGFWIISHRSEGLINPSSNCE